MVISYNYHGHYFLHAFLGQPKGIVRDNGGHAVVLHWSMEHLYGLKPDDVWWAASDIGWVV